MRDDKAFWLELVMDDAVARNRLKRWLEHPTYDTLDEVVETLIQHEQEYGVKLASYIELLAAAIAQARDDQTRTRVGVVTHIDTTTHLMTVKHYPKVGDVVQLTLDEGGKINGLSQDD